MFRRPGQIQLLLDQTAYHSKLEEGGGGGMVYDDQTKMIWLTFAVDLSVLVTHSG